MEFIKFLIIALFITSFLMLVACSSEPQIPKRLTIEQVSQNNTEKWDVKVLPRLDNGVWVYDTKIKYLGELPVDVSVKHYDGTLFSTYQIPPQVSMDTWGSFDYEGSVYSKENRQLEFNIIWQENGKELEESAVFEVNPLN